MIESYLLSVINGESRKPADRLVLLGLSLLEPVYGTLVLIRSALYRLGVLPRRRLPAPVVSVGNLAAGGTGKTPLSIYLAKRLSELDRRPGVVIRGYRGKGEGVRLVTADLSYEDTGDEALLLFRKLPGGFVVVGADRFLAGSLAVGNGAETLVLDDAFQQRGIIRDLDILLLHAAKPWENGHLIPRGLLREGKRASRRADLIVLTGIEALSEAKLEETAAEVGRIHPGCPVLRMRTRPVAVLPLADWWRGEQKGEDAEGFLRGKAIGAFTAIGRPEKFLATLESLGARIAQTWLRPDHADWEGENFAQTGADDGRPLLTTEKDAVKLETFLRKPIASRIFVLTVQAEFSEGDRELLDQKLREL